MSEYLYIKLTGNRPAISLIVSSDQYGIAQMRQQFCTNALVYVRMVIP